MARKERKIMTIPKEIENWMKYEKVRRTGMFNMILGYKMASKTAGLSIKEYNEVLKRYHILKEKAEKLYTPTQIDDMIKLI
jgi:hypothetical protein